MPFASIRVCRAHERLVEAEVVEGAFVTVLLLSVVVGGIGDEFRKAQVPADLQRGEVEAVRHAALRGIGVHELVVVRVGIQRPVVVDVVLVLVLVVDPRSHGPLVRDLPQRREAHEQRVAEVGVLLGLLPADRVDVVNPAAIAPVGDREARTQHPLDQRAADGRAGLVARRPALRVGDFLAAVDRAGGEARLGGDVAHRATLGAGAEQRALRAAQHLDAIDVEGLRQRLVGIEGERTHLDRRVIHVDAGGAGAAGAGYAADRDVVRAGVVEVYARGEARDFLEVLDATVVHVLLGERGDADRHLAQGLLAPGGRDGDLLQWACGCGLRRLLLGERRPSSAHQHQGATHAPEMRRP